MEADDGPVCAICLYPLVDGEAYLFAPTPQCPHGQHSFHPRCLRLWTGPDCPTCRQALDPNMRLPSFVAAEERRCSGKTERERRRLKCLYALLIGSASLGTSLSSLGLSDADILAALRTAENDRRWIKVNMHSGEVEMDSTGYLSHRSANLDDEEVNHIAASQESNVRWMRTQDWFCNHVFSSIEWMRRLAGLSTSVESAGCSRPWVFHFLGRAGNGIRANPLLIGATREYQNFILHELVPNCYADAFLENVEQRLESECSRMECRHDKRLRITVFDSAILSSQSLSASASQLDCASAVISDVSETPEAAALEEVRAEIRRARMASGTRAADFVRRVKLEMRRLFYEVYIAPKTHYAWLTNTVQPLQSFVAVEAPREDVPALLATKKLIPTLDFINQVRAAVASCINVGDSQPLSKNSPEPLINLEPKSRRDTDSELSNESGLDRPTEEEE